MTKAVASTSGDLRWLEIIRLGLVQTALGMIVVLTTSTINRIMVVELSLFASIPAALGAFHYAVQLSRPRWGFGSDVGGKRAPWIIGGIAVLGFGGFLAAYATTLVAGSFWTAMVVSVIAFGLVGAGVGAAGTSVLALLATHTSERRRPAAASIVWIMMIFGMAGTAGGTSQFLDPFTFTKLLTICGSVSVLAVILTILALWGIEPRLKRIEPQNQPGLARQAFLPALKEVWKEDKPRQFTIFVFVSMLAFSAQDYVLEPFGGLVYGMTPGETQAMAGIQNGGVLIGMILVAILGSAVGGRLGSMKLWAVLGCLGSALAFSALIAAARVAPNWPLTLNVFALGFSNGAFAVAAIGSMMGLASGESFGGREGRAGLRMGLWGAAQAMGFGLGILVGAAVFDVARAILGEASGAFALVFAGEAILFIVSAWLAFHVAPNAALQSKSLPQPSSSKPSSQGVPA